MIPAFAFAYFISYSFRSVTAVAGAAIGQDLGLTASALGLLSGVYFIGFGSMQLPLGALLDRYGARRIEPLLLLAAAAGSWWFSAARSLPQLVAGRALVGLGVSACLMAPLKTFAVAFPRHRQPQLASTMLVAGTLGAATMSVPVEALIRIAGWRLVFKGLSIACVLAAIILVAVLPRSREGLDPTPWGAQLRAFAAIFRHAAFRRLAPVAVFQHGGFMAVQGLWAGLWLTDALGSPPATAAQQILILNLAALAAYLMLAAIGQRLVQRHGTINLFATGLLLSALFLGLALLPQVNRAPWAWALYASCASVTSWSYSLLTPHFPREEAGRAVTALNLLIFIGGFGVQWGMGVLIQAAPLPRLAAYRLGFGLFIVLQLAASLWLWRGRQHLQPALPRNA